jgi:DNA-binding GntR family transcriptional regulator
MGLLSLGVAARSSQLSDQAASYVRDLIMSGRIGAGVAIRPGVIATAMGTSNTPVREALQALRAEGFLYPASYRGFTVAPLTGTDVRDIFRAHAAISGELAARAAVLAQDSDIVELEAIQSELLAAAHSHDIESLEERNHSFHRLVNTLADARKMTWVLGLTGRYVPRRSYGEINGWPQASAEDHSSIIDGIRRGDPDVARSQMIGHVVHSGELLAQYFDKRR